MLYFWAPATHPKLQDRDLATGSPLLGTTCHTPRCFPCHSCPSSTVKLCCGSLRGASLLDGCQQILHTHSQCGFLVISGRQSSFQQNYPGILFGDLRFSGVKAALVILLPLPHTSRKHPYFAMKALVGLVSAPPLCTQLLSVPGACRLKQPG